MLDKCYLCRNKLDPRGTDDDSWYVNTSDRIPLCKKCSRIIAKKFKSWVRSLRKKRR